MSCTPVNMTRRMLRCCSLYTHGKFTPYAICGMVRAKVRPSRSPPPLLTQRVLDRYREQLLPWGWLLSTVGHALPLWHFRIPYEADQSTYWDSMRSAARGLWTALTVAALQLLRAPCKCMLRAQETICVPRLALTLCVLCLPGRFGCGVGVPREAGWPPLNR